jgi:hypothetical protein
MAPTFPFLVGCGRSGTTLLRAMVDSHPQIAIPPGSGFVRQLVRDPGLAETGGRFDRERFVAFLGGHERFPAWGLDALALDAALDPEPPDLGEALRRVYAAYAASEGKPRYGDKTHRYVMDIGVLAARFPESRFVHIVRDGRNVALSLVEAPFGPSNLTEAAAFWRGRVGRGRADGQRLGPRRYLEIHYEDLVADPEATLRAVCGFLDLAWDEAMLRYYERAGAVARGLRYPQIHRALSEPTRVTRDWRTTLSTRDLERFEAVAGSTLIAFGYERGAQVPVHLQVEAGVRRLRGEVHRGLGRMRRGVVA